MSCTGFRRLSEHGKTHFLGADAARDQLRGAFWLHSPLADTYCSTNSAYSSGLPSIQSTFVLASSSTTFLDSYAVGNDH